MSANDLHAFCLQLQNSNRTTLQILMAIDMNNPTFQHSDPCKENEEKETAPSGKLVYVNTSKRVKHPDY
jgi:hypothetical protein